MDKPQAISQAAAQWIRTELQRRGITERQFAEQTRIARVTWIRKADTAPQNLNLGELERIAAFFGVKVSDITLAAESAA